MAMIKPTIPAAPQSISLSPMDQAALRVYVQLVLCFPLPGSRPTEHKEIYSKLSIGLARTLSEIPIIGGTIVAEDGDSGRVRIDIAEGYGGKLIRQDFTGKSSGLGYSYEELQKEYFPTSLLDPDKLAPLKKVPDYLEPAPVMAAQANFFDDGLILTVCCHHSALDASSIATILKRWAENTGADATMKISEELLATSIDRAPMMPGQSGATMADFPEYKVSNDKPPEELLWGSGPGKEYCIFSFSKSHLEELKNLSSQPNISSGRISTNDALSAFLWHHITLARHRRRQNPENSEGPANLAIAINGRERLSPPLSVNYIGNAVWTCQITLDEDVVTSPDLYQIAKFIRAATTRLDSDYLKKVIEAISSLPKGTKLTITGFENPAQMLSLSSWAEMGLYDLNWKDIGQAEAIRLMRFPKGGGIGTGTIYPRLVDQSLEVILGLEPQTMKELKANRDFVKFAEWKCT